MPSASLRSDATPPSRVPSRAAGHASPLLSALFLVVVGLVVLRVTLTPLLLDLVLDYTADQGSIVEKLHPALYGFAGVAIVGLLCFRITLDTWEVAVVRTMMAFLAGLVTLIVLTTLAGRGGNAGFLVDTYAGACFCALLFLFPIAWRNAVGQILVGWMVVSALVALVEFALKTRFQPFTETEYSFRPIGLAGHPLELGMWNAVGLSFCAATEWSRRTKVAVCLVLLLALGASGARLALMIGLVSALVLALGATGTGLSSRKRMERRIIVLTAAFVVVPLLLAVLFAAGGLARFQDGLVDSNSRARVDIYRVFDYLTWPEFLLGSDIAKVRKIALDRLRLEFIESSIVIFVSQFGLIGTGLFVGLFGWLVRVLLRGAKAAVLLGTLVFFVIVLSSNGLSSKGSSIVLLFTMIVAFRPGQEPRRAGLAP